MLVYEFKLTYLAADMIYFTSTSIP